MKKILVTGASGFIGRHCLPFLVQRGFEVHGTSTKAAFQSEDIQMHQIDLLDRLQVDRLLKILRPSHLLHLAWIATPPLFWTSQDNLLWVQSSLWLMQSFIKQGGNRAVFSGSCAEYDWSYDMCSELSTPLNPSTLYGQSKKTVFESLSTFSQNWAWGRIFHLYGPGEPSIKFIASVILSLLKGEKAPCSHGNQIRDFLHVQDVALALSALVEGSLVGAVNIASGIPISLKSVCQKIGQKIGLPENILFGAKSPAPNDPPVLIADVNRLYNELFWKPTIDLDQGLEQTIQWWKEQFVQKKI